MPSPPQPPQSQSLRKRTCSFSSPLGSPSSPRPAKLPRHESASPMGSLRRTETVLCIPESKAAESSAMAASSMTAVASTRTPIPSSSPMSGSANGIPYKQSMQYYKDQRQRQKAMLNRTIEPITIRNPVRIPDPSHPLYNAPPRQYVFPDPYAPSPRAKARPARAQPKARVSSFPKPLPAAPAPVAPAKQCQPPLPYRLNSPLSPQRVPIPLPPHLLNPFPVSKRQPSLYKKALLTKVKRLPEGPQFVRMGPRAYGVVMDATLDLERLVNSHSRESRDREDDRDVVMADGTMTMSSSSMLSMSSTWMVEDFEMVDAP